MGKENINEKEAHAAHDKERKKKEQQNEKENPNLHGIAQRFSIDNPYFHDIIESCEGPMKVWSIGEKLEHDKFWQNICA